MSSEDVAFLGPDDWSPPALAIDQPTDEPQTRCFADGFKSPNVYEMRLNTPYFITGPTDPPGNGTLISVTISGYVALPMAGQPLGVDESVTLLYNGRRFALNNPQDQGVGDTRCGRLFATIPLQGVDSETLSFSQAPPPPPPPTGPTPPTPEEPHVYITEMRAEYYPDPAATPSPTSIPAPGVDPAATSSPTSIPAPVATQSKSSGSWIVWGIPLIIGLLLAVAASVFLWWWCKRRKTRRTPPSAAFAAHRQHESKDSVAGEAAALLQPVPETSRWAPSAGTIRATERDQDAVVAKQREAYAAMQEAAQSRSMDDLGAV